MGLKAPKEIIGRGTWIDKVAKRILEREAKLGRSTTLLRVESGLGASGIPHIGSLSDAIRAYGVELALGDQGYRSELIAFSDDMDGLRKVPSGLPETLDKFIGTPVFMVPDPFSCHGSYGQHMGSLLRDALDKCGIEYKFQSGADAYRKGLLNEQIVTLMENSEIIGRKIAEMLGQKKFEKSLPFFPVCEGCGRVYLADAYEYVKDERKVLYRCSGSELGGKKVRGCGYEGEMSVLRGFGKLSWKCEFAARWAALGIRFEAYGKDIADSVKVNDWVSDNILHFPHPYHIRYEMFLDRSGRKISKSLGNVFTPQAWLRYGSPQSLRLLMFKRVVGTRNISVDDIPTYMDEYDALEDVYFGRVKVQNPLKLARLKGLYEYVNLLRSPQVPDEHVPYRMLVQLASVAPSANRIDYIKGRLISYRMAKEITPHLTEKIKLASNWAEDFRATERVKVTLSGDEKETIRELITVIREYDDPEKIQGGIFDAARKHGMEASLLFKRLYQILIGSDRGPRLGRYIVDIGREEVIRLLLEQTSDGEHQA